MKLAIGSDHYGLALKKKIMTEFEKRGYLLEDFGTFDENPVDYPDIALKVAKSISDGSCDRGILICGTGIGMAIAANKVKGVYAAVCHDIYSTERSILSNNVQIMCMGAQVIGPSTAVKLVESWLELEFKHTASVNKINKIKRIENGYVEVT